MLSCCVIRNHAFERAVMRGWLESVDGWDKVPSFNAVDAARRSTSSSGYMISIRAADVRDAPRLVPLMRELGYEVSAQLMVDKLRALLTLPSDNVMVATAGEALIGCIGCHVLELLHAPGRVGRITALVVAATHQRQGVGARLLAAAEEFFKSLGCVRVEVTSGNHRAGAHAFYTSLGFSESDTRFIKSI